LYPRYSPLDAEISEVLMVMDTAVDKVDAGVKVVDNAVGSNERAPSWATLRPHSMQLCLPHILTSDGAEPPVAAETISWRPTPNVRLVAPCKLFWKLESEGSEQLLLLKASPWLRLHCVNLANALGVRDRPDLADWVACTRTVRDNYEQARLDEP